MYHNVGRKIKVLAIILAVIFMVLAFAGGLIVATMLWKNDNIRAVAYFLLIVVIGMLSGWLSGVLLYGFGELIDKTTEISERQEDAQEALNEIIDLLAKTSDQQGSDNKKQEFFKTDKNEKKKSDVSCFVKEQKDTAREISEHRLDETTCNNEKQNPYNISGKSQAKLEVLLSMKEKGIITEDEYQHAVASVKVNDAVDNK